MSETVKKAVVKKKAVVSAIPVIAAQPDGEAFKIPAQAYKNLQGSFGLMTRAGDKITSIHWEGCRDCFQSSSDSAAMMDFLFYHSVGSGDNVIAFLKTVEAVIKVKEEDRLIIRKTSNPNVLYILMSTWWKYRLRRSLLSALLRCGQFYADKTPKGFEKALYSQYYTAQTKPAIEQFFKGRTGSKLKGRSGFSGWYQQFHGKQKDDVRKTLVKILPKPPVPEVPEVVPEATPEVPPSV